MAHKLNRPEGEQKPTSKRFKVKIPNMTGKFGFSLFIAKKEVFIGVLVGEVEVEQIIRRRMVKVPKKGTVKVYRFD